MLTVHRPLLACLTAATLTGIAAIAGQRSTAVEPATAIACTTAPDGLPWWKRSLAHTVQEEWLFAQHMDSQYGPRWRTALPDKSVVRLYQAWVAGRETTP